MLKATGSTNCQVYETVRYSSYGVPFGITPGDIEPDGDVDGDDNDNWPGSYEVRCDYDLDGDMDVTDQNFTIANSGRTLGRGVLSHSSVANRKGYCGYEHDGVIDTLAHVRHRALMTELGRWTRRDPLDYIDGRNLYDLVAGRVHQFVDPLGLQRVPVDGWDTRMRYSNGHGPGLMCSIIDEFSYTCDGETIITPPPCGGNSPPCPRIPQEVWANPLVRSQWDRVLAKCRCTPIVLCTSHIIGGSCGATFPAAPLSCPTILVSFDAQCTTSSDQIARVLVHELEHAYQYCAYGLPPLFSACEDLICREVAAYDRDGSCSNWQAHSWRDKAECLCYWACGSVNAVLGGACNLLNDCTRKCESQMKFNECSDGRYTRRGSRSNYAPPSE